MNLTGPENKKISEMFANLGKQVKALLENSATVAELAYNHTKDLDELKATIEKLVKETDKNDPVLTSVALEENDNLVFKDVLDEDAGNMADM